MWERIMANAKQLNTNYFITTAHSNIINIVLKTDTLYNTSQESPYNEFRVYCGKILSELFNTNIEQTIDYNNIYKN